MPKMIAVRMLAFVTVTFSLPYAAGTAKAESPAVKLSAPSAVVAQGAPVTLDVTLVNTTGHELIFWVAPGGHNAELFYDIVGKNAEGEDIARTAYGVWVCGGPVMMVSRSQKTLSPDQSYGEFMEVSKIFDLSHSGRYTFQVERTYLRNQKVDIPSNPVTIEVK